MVIAFLACFAKQHPRYQHYETRIQVLKMDDFGEISMRKYLAMSSVLLLSNQKSGWMCDYDVFPLRDFRTAPIPDPFLTYSVVGATLASGSAANWEAILDAILEEAQESYSNNTTTTTTSINLWSDLLSSYALLRKGTMPRPARQVMPGNLLLPAEGWSKEYCNKRQFRKRFLVVHMDTQSLVAQVEPHELFQPQHRASVARRVIANYERHCGVKVIDENATTSTRV